MGEKVSFVIQYVSMTLTGITIGIIYTWKLGLVTLSVSPLLVFSGALLFIVSFFAANCRFVNALIPLKLLHWRLLISN